MNWLESEVGDRVEVFWVRDNASMTMREFAEAMQAVEPVEGRTVSLRPLIVEVGDDVIDVRAERAHVRVLRPAVIDRIKADAERVLRRELAGGYVSRWAVCERLREVFYAHLSPMIGRDYDVRETDRGLVLRFMSGPFTESVTRFDFVGVDNAQELARDHAAALPCRTGIDDQT